MSVYNVKYDLKSGLGILTELGSKIPGSQGCELLGPLRCNVLKCPKSQWGKGRENPEFRTSGRQTP